MSKTRHGPAHLMLRDGRGLTKSREEAARREALRTDPAQRTRTAWGRGGWQRASPAGSAGHPEDVLLATGECSEDTVVGAVV